MNNFKVGDWVNVTPNSKRGRVNYPKPFLGKIVVIDTLETQETVYCVHGQKKSDWVCESDIEKWKAKDGELCVFPRKPDEDIYRVCRFNVEYHEIEDALPLDYLQTLPVTV